MPLEAELLCFLDTHTVEVDDQDALWPIVEGLGCNLAGVDVILNLMDRMRGLHLEIARLQDELQRERDRQLPAPRRFDGPFGGPFDGPSDGATQR